MDYFRTVLIRKITETIDSAERFLENSFLWFFEICFSGLGLILVYFNQKIIEAKRLRKIKTPI